MRHTRTLLVAAATALLAVAGVAAPAAAAPPDFAAHVRECNHSFTGTHNPGVHHQGYAGWMGHMADHESHDMSACA